MANSCLWNLSSVKHFLKLRKINKMLWSWTYSKMTLTVQSRDNSVKNVILLKCTFDDVNIKHLHMLTSPAFSKRHNNAILSG